MKKRNSMACIAVFAGLIVASCSILPADQKKTDFVTGFETGEDLSQLVSYNRDEGYNSQFATDTKWIVKNDFAAHSGSRTIGSIYNDDGSANDDWLMLPAMTLSDESVLTLFAAPQYIDASEESFEVMISTSGNMPESFEQQLLQHVFPQNTDSWTEFNIDLAEYAGQTVHIAIHCTSVDQYCLRIDDITVTNVEL